MKVHTCLTACTLVVSFKITMIETFFDVMTYNIQTAGFTLSTIFASEVKIEESEKPAVTRNRTQGTWLEPSVLPLSYDNWTGTIPNGVLMAHTEWLPGV